MAQTAAGVLEAAQTALGTEREGIRNTLERLVREAQQLQNIDTMLGRVMEQYNKQLNDSLGTAQSYIDNMKKTLEPGIDTLKGVVERAESFMPASRRP